MKIFVTGGTGFVGANLCETLLKKGHSVILTGTRRRHPLTGRENVRYIRADTTQPGDWQEAVQEADAAVNLAGRTIFHLWTKSYKKKIYDSRILTTRNLADAVPADASKPFTLISASAAGFYGDRGDDPLTERAANGDDFLAGVCRDWEAEAFKAQDKGARVAATRFGVVLGKNGGALKKMIPAFKLFAGGPLGDGKQWFPWIHLDDLIAGIMFCLDHPDIQGPVNFCAPTPVRNRHFAKMLAGLLKRPAFMPAPAFMIRLAVGEFGDALLGSQRAVPEKLQDAGFSFTYPDIRSALSQVLGRPA